MAKSNSCFYWPYFRWAGSTGCFFFVYCIYYRFLMFCIYYFTVSYLGDFSIEIGTCDLILRGRSTNLNNILVWSNDFILLRWIWRDGAWNSFSYSLSSFDTLLTFYPFKDNNCFGVPGSYRVYLMHSLIWMHRKQICIWRGKIIVYPCSRFEMNTPIRTFLRTVLDISPLKSKCFNTL